MVLPDILQPHLTIVFCGTPASNMSAERGAYYAHPDNKFYRVLHETGLTNRLLDPQEFRKPPQYGIGLTDMNKTQSGNTAIYVLPSTSGAASASWDAAYWHDMAEDVSKTSQITRS